MERTMSTSLSATLSSMITNFSNTDQKWVVFVLDHLELIKQNSQRISIDSAIIDRYKYKFEHFLRDNNCTQAINWIAYLVNDLAAYEEFTLKSVIFIPDVSYLNLLYRKYRYSQNKG